MCLIKDKEKHYDVDFLSRFFNIFFIMMIFIIGFTTITHNIYRETSLRNTCNYCVTLTLILKLWGHAGGKNKRCNIVVFK